MDGLPTLPATEVHHASRPPVAARAFRTPAQAGILRQFKRQFRVTVAKMLSYRFGRAIPIAFVLMLVSASAVLASRLPANAVGNAFSPSAATPADVQYGRQGVSPTHSQGGPGNGSSPTHSRSAHSGPTPHAKQPQAAAPDRGTVVATQSGSLPFTGLNVLTVLAAASALMAAGLMARAGSRVWRSGRARLDAS